MDHEYLLLLSVHFGQFGETKSDKDVNLKQSYFQTCVTFFETCEHLESRNLKNCLDDELKKRRRLITFFVLCDIFV